MVVRMMPLVRRSDEPCLDISLPWLDISICYSFRFISRTESRAVLGR